jgi:hypothetical protein
VGLRHSYLLVCAGLVGCGAGAPSVADGGSGDAGADQDAATSAGDAAFYPLPDGGEIAADRFVTGVVSVTYGPCAGFGQGSMPQIVYGPPIGGGTSQGSTDVVSLGVGGSIVLSFAPNAIVDGNGVDFVVFENAFQIGGNKGNIYAEPGEVSVSDDGVTWFTYPCTATAGNPPYGSCAGVNIVLSSPTSGISPVDYPACGGDGFDLQTLGVTHARYVRIVDHSGETCDPKHPTNTAGFDLDAISIINAEKP